MCTLNPMNVSELARRAGIAPSAVRWYEREGVIPRAARGGNGYRQFSDEHLARLRLVVSFRRLGMDPREAGNLALLCLQRSAVDGALAPLLERQHASIARQRAVLNRVEGELLDLELTLAAVERAKHKETDMDQPPIRVLFVCTGNSARSQIGEALLKRFGGPDFEVHSAGTQPKGVNPYTVRVLAESGIDWSAATSKTIDTFLDQRFDYVITVCDRARATCPVFPGSQNSLHWGLEDPAEVDGTDEEKLRAFRDTEMQLTQRLRPFVEVALRAAGRDRRPAFAG